MVDPWEVPELKIRERSTFGAHPSGRVVNVTETYGQMLKE
jgi:hypothetical protein